MSKQPKKTVHSNKNAEASLGRNPIAGLFVRKALNRRVGSTKRGGKQRGGMKKRGNSTSEATPKSKSLNSNTTGKSNIIPVHDSKKNEEEKNKRMRWSAGYFNKVQE